MKKLIQILCLVPFFTGAFFASATAADCEAFGGTYLICTVEEHDAIVEAVREACDGDFPSSGVYIVYADDCAAPDF